MQIIHSFGISPRVYHMRGTGNDFPEIDICPLCSYPGPLDKHGFYWRNALFLRWDFCIPIRRYQCPSCERTLSILPDFLLPYYQYSLVFVLEALRGYFIECKRKIGYQLVQFYRCRFLKNLNRVEAFFRDLEFREVFLEKDKAIKLLEMIRAAFPKAEAFAKRYQEHFLCNFMGKLILPRNAASGKNSFSHIPFAWSTLPDYFTMVLR